MRRELILKGNTKIKFVFSPLRQVFKHARKITECKCITIKSNLPYMEKNVKD